MPKRVFLVRHGQTAYNLQRRFQGQADIPLDATGRGQAQAVATHLAGRGITRLFSSDLSRAHETARAIGGAIGLEPVTDAGLREVGVGDWEGLTRDEIAPRWPAEFALWNAGRDVRPPRGESLQEAGSRVHSTVGTLLKTCADDDVVAIVAHGAVIRGATQMFLGLDSDGPLGQLGALKNCNYASLQYRSEHWYLDAWGWSVD
jgi:broad specificity phosphatase PhoE